MSQVKRALERIGAAAQKAGGASRLGELAGVGPHAARRMVKEEPQGAILDLMKMEAAAEKLLGAEPAS